MTATEKLIKHLVNGKEVSAKEITAKFGLANARSAINRIRKQGYVVYNRPVTLRDGTKTKKYKIGEPTRAMIAAAYSVLGSDMF